MTINCSGEMHLHSEMGWIVDAASGLFTRVGPKLVWSDFCCCSMCGSPSDSTMKEN